MNVGDELVTGTWLTGRETDADLEQARDWLRSQMRDMAEDILDEGKFHLIGPEHDRCPPAGPDDHVFLVYETKITGHRLTAIRGRFTDELDKKDLDRLVQILLTVYPMYNPGKPAPSREKCLGWIDENGPECALQALREQVTVH